MKNILEKVKKEDLGGIKKALENIKKEGEISDIEIEKIEEDEERFEICGYDEEVEEVEINRPVFKVFVACALGLSLVAAAPKIVNTKVIEPNVYVVEAKTTKKDTKKPVIKFSGKNTMEVEKDKTVKIPKVTAKDNRDGNVTKKIKVTVKKGKKSYSKIAKAVKNNKKTKFTSTGTYKITYTVTDKAGNKASKTRKVKVISAKKKEPVITTTEITTQNDITEVPTTKEVTTENLTTEKVTTENPTTNPKYRVDYSEFNMGKVTINGKTYNTTKDYNFYKITDANEKSNKIFINIENDYDTLVFDADTGLTDNSSYLSFLGEISAYDENGNDISDNIVIYELALIADGYVINFMDYVLYIYVEDIYGNTLRKPLDISLRSSYEDLSTDEAKDLKLINNSPIVYARKRINEDNLSSNVECKTLKFLDK